MGAELKDVLYCVWSLGRTVSSNQTMSLKGKVSTCLMTVFVGMSLDRCWEARPHKLNPSYPACNMASEVNRIILINALNTLHAFLLHISMRNVFMLLGFFQRYLPQTPLFPQPSHQRWPTILSRATAGLLLQVCVYHFVFHWRIFD